MDQKLKSECLALVLMFVSFPLVSFGTTSGNSFIWWLGLICLVVGGLLPVSTRYMDHSHDTIRDIGMEFDERTS